LAEDSVEEVAEFLGAFPTPAGQPFGEWGKASDVEEQQASIDNSVGSPPISGSPRFQALVRKLGLDPRALARLRANARARAARLSAVRKP